MIKLSQEERVEIASRNLLLYYKGIALMKDKQAKLERTY
jgi:hypothetical protein